MSFNGSGTFNLATGNPVVTGTTISSTWANNTLSDIATGLSNCITRDGQSPATANIPMGTHKLTGLSAGTTAGDSARYEQVTSAVAITGGAIDGTPIGGTTPAAGAFTTLSASSTVTLSGGTANGVLYLNGSKVATSGSALTFDGTNLGVGGSTDPFGRFYTRSIGITSSGSSALEINGSSYGGIDLGAGGTRYFGITANSTDVILGSLNGAVPLEFLVNGSEQMRLTSTGLGIGTSSPGAKLDVAGAIKTSGAPGVASLYVNVTSAGAAGALTLQRSGTVKRYVGLDASDNFAIIDTGGGSQLVVDSSGNLLVGTTTANNNNSTSFAFNIQNGNQFCNHINGTASGTGYVQFVYNGTVIGSITQNGTTGVLYNTSSDYRLKNITSELTGYKDRIMALQPKQGTWKADGSEFRGFLAHEFAEQYPAAVSGEKDAVDEDGNPKYQGMQAGGSETIADLVALVKELVTEIETLKSQLGK